MPLYLCALWQLLRFDYYLGRRDFALLYRKVLESPMRANNSFLAEQILTAIDLVCIWYPKHVLCLQRSAATTCLLRRYAIPARMVIGAKQMPFKAHAWVEVDSRVMNDKPYIAEIYAVLDRC